VFTLQACEVVIEHCIDLVAVDGQRTTLKNLPKHEQASAASLPDTTADTSFLVQVSG